MKNEFKKVRTDFRTGTIAYYGPNDKIIYEGVSGAMVLMS
jgi:hypothetical protein